MAYRADVPSGTIVVSTNERRLYLVLGQGRAMVYPVGVGRAGRQWAGRSTIDSKRIRRRGDRQPTSSGQSGLPDVIPGGSPKNPMGAAALTLSGGQYAIHGTNNPGSIGGFVSYGCIRMYNQDITDLYGRVERRHAGDRHPLIQAARSFTGTSRRGAQRNTRRAAPTLSDADETSGVARVDAMAPKLH